MRARSRVGSCFHAVASLALLWAGCGGDDFASPEGGFGGAGAGGSGGESGSGGTGGTAPGCVPSVNVDPIEESCGVFVSSSLGAAGGDRSKDKPFKSIQSALAAAKGKPIYVCAEDAAYDEKLVVTGAVRLYGGLDCKDDWKYRAAKPTRVAPAKGVPLTVSDVSGAVGIRTSSSRQRTPRTRGIERRGVREGIVGCEDDPSADRGWQGDEGGGWDGCVVYVPDRG